MRYLYHGSTTQNLKVLEPKKRYTPTGEIDHTAIYATPLLAYAAAHAFSWSSDEGIDLEVNNDHVVLVLPRKFNQRLQVPISIYKIMPDNFEHTKEETTGHTWHTTKSVSVLEEKKYDSVEEAFKKLEVELVYR